jgi:hypothetical protein
VPKTKGQNRRCKILAELTAGNRETSEENSGIVGGQSNKLRKAGMLGMQSVCCWPAETPPTLPKKGAFATQKEQHSRFWRDLMNASVARLNARAGERNRNS